MTGETIHVSIEHRLIRIASAPTEGLPASPSPSPLPAGAYTPAIDIHEGPEGLILEADLPGATESSLRIELEQNVLNLYAQIARPVPEGSRLLHEESRVGEYFRSFILTDEVQKDLIRAELKNGVLRLVLPRAERGKSRRIEVNAS